MGKHKAAIEIYDEAAKLVHNDWEVDFNKGQCFMYLKEYDEAVKFLMSSNSIQRHDNTYTALAKVHVLREDFESAKATLKEALEFSPSNPEILISMGLLCLRLGDTFSAFEYLGAALAQDPKNPKGILAVGSIIQDHNDMDVALMKYRIAAYHNPNSPHLWNNVGMCFFGKQKTVAAVACLKRALYLAPLEWIIAYNLGLVHLSTKQYASAFHFFSASINLKGDFAPAYMYLAMTLSALGDNANAWGAYRKSLQIDDDFLCHLNFAISLYQGEEIVEAKEHFQKFETVFRTLGDEVQNADADILNQRRILSQSLKIPLQ